MVSGIDGVLWFNFKHDIHCMILCWVLIEIRLGVRRNLLSFWASNGNPSYRLLTVHVIRISDWDRLKIICNVTVIRYWASHLYLYIVMIYENYLFLIHSFNRNREFKHLFSVFFSFDEHSCFFIKDLGIPAFICIFPSKHTSLTYRRYREMI